MPLFVHDAAMWQHLQNDAYTWHLLSLLFSLLLLVSDLIWYELTDSAIKLIYESESGGTEKIPYRSYDLERRYTRINRAALPLHTKTSNFISLSSIVLLITVNYITESYLLSVFF